MKKTCSDCQIAKPIYTRKRVKFGIFFVLLTFVCGLGIILWLIWPRRKVVIGYEPEFICGLHRNTSPPMVAPLPQA